MLIELHALIEKIYLKELNHKLQKKCQVDENTFFYKTATVLTDKQREGIQIGANCHIRGELINVSGKRRLIIGEWCYLGERSTLWSSGADLIVGDRVLIAKDVFISNNNSHPIEANSRYEHYKHIVTKGHPLQSDLHGQTIKIEDDVWIGCKSIILKGVTIGKGSIVAAGSVVTKDVPEGVMVAENPAKIVKRL